MNEPSLTKEQLDTMRKSVRDFNDRTVDRLDITPRDISQLIAATETLQSSLKTCRELCDELRASEHALLRENEKLREGQWPPLPEIKPITTVLKKLK